MTLNEINARIQKVEPLVTLYRGEGYHYYIFDNTPLLTEDNKRLVYENESVMCAYLKDQRPRMWIADGISFGKRVRGEHGL
jgi:hypothetical protein